MSLHGAIPHPRPMMEAENNPNISAPKRSALRRLHDVQFKISKEGWHPGDLDLVASLFAELALETQARS